MKTTTMNQESQTHNGTERAYRIARTIAAVSLVFAAVIGVLLIVNYIQTASVDPLHSEALSTLKARAIQNPGDEALKEEIRAIDLLARKAYFTNLWQVRTGGFLLFLFAVAFLVSVRYLHARRRDYPDLSNEPQEDRTWRTEVLTRRSTMIAATGFFGLALVLAALTTDDWGTAGPGGAETAESSASWPTAEQIESNWPGFRGPHGLGIAHVDSAPVTWDGSSGEGILWKTEIPVSGFSSPVIWGTKLFLSGADRRTQVVYCIDTGTGAIIWEHELNDVPGSPAEKPDVTEDTGLAAPTMATDGRRAYVLFGTGDAAALDFDGNRVWARNLGVPDNHYGHSSSPIVWRDLLLVQYDQNSGGRLIALDTATGGTVYDQPRDTEISWASPVLVEAGGSTQAVLNASPFVMGHDPETGRELWRVDCMSGEVAPSPAFADGVVFAVNEYAELAAIGLNGTAELLWESLDDLSEVSSPVAAGGFLFVATSYGTVSCFDTASGERRWFEDLPDGFYSSPVIAGGTVYLMDMNGVMHIVRAAGEYTPVGTCELGEQAVTVPAFMHGRIYIRGYENLYCIGEQ